MTEHPDREHARSMAELDEDRQREDEREREARHTPATAPPGGWPAAEQAP